jgi:hypothetical protein
LPTESFRLDVSREPGSSTWTRAFVDLDRDGNGDEKWFLADGRPGKRKISTHDDRRYDREERWRDGRWVRKRGAW